MVKSTRLSKQNPNLTTDLTVDVVTSGAATVAVVSGTLLGKEFTWTGDAKVCPEDKFHPDVAALLSVGRALEKAGRQLQRQGNGLVKSIDDNRRQAAEAAKRETKAVKPRRDKQQRRQTR
jgi:hypothetical protein